jgi:hypothetical protein
VAENIFKIVSNNTMYTGDLLPRTCSCTTDIDLNEFGLGLVKNPENSTYIIPNGGIIVYTWVCTTTECKLRSWYYNAQNELNVSRETIIYSAGGVSFSVIEFLWRVDVTNLDASYFFPPIAANCPTLCT